MKYRILASEKLEIPESVNAMAAIDVIDGLWQNNEKLAAIAKGYDALIVRNMTQVNAELMKQLVSIKVIGRLGAGTENIDIRYAKQCKIPVVYAPVQNSNAVAEFCVAQVFNALRNIPMAIHEAKHGVWNRSKYLTLGREVSSCTIGVIGFGHIGKAFAQKMTALGANVLVYNRTQSKVTPPFKYSTLERLLTSSDVVSIHLPGGNDTKDFIHQANIGLFKKGAFLINSSRGDVINEQALLEALNSKQLAGAMLDVRLSEPASADALALHEKVYPTPHIGAFSLEAQLSITKSVVHDIVKVLNNERPNYPVLVS
jgi:D-3-phosphoglycerate dehydrogenase